MSDRGIFILSLDVELAWGTFDKGKTERLRPQFEAERSIIAELLQLLERHQLSATWAIVGHLWLSGCAGHDDLPHFQAPWYPRDWYACDPRSDVERDPLWYGPDIVAAIARATPPQDIGSHSFSHVVFDERWCPPELAQAELARCVELAETTGTRLRSFVYPRNVAGHTAALGRAGFSSYRGAEPFWFRRLPARGGPLYRVLDDGLMITPPVVRPERAGPGLWNIPGSMFYRPADGLRAALPVRWRVRKARRGIDRAIREGKIFHLWLHPFNMAARRAAMFDGLSDILEYASMRRAEGALELLSMAQLAERMGA